MDGEHKTLDADNMKIITTALLIACALIPTTFADEAGAKLYQQLIGRYQGLTSYQDEGTAVSYLGEKKSKQTLLFKTHFHDPYQLRFEFITYHPYGPLNHIKTKHVILHNEGACYSVRNEEVEEETSLGMMIAGATGISDGVALIVPTLLMNQGQWVGKDPVLTGEEEIDGRLCHHLQINIWNGMVWNIWISKDDILIRRIEEDGTEINYNLVTINEEMPKSVFQLNPNNNSSNQSSEPTCITPVE